VNGSTRRLALALCVVAVVLAALLFPATGLDAAPAGPIGSGDDGPGPDPGNTSGSSSASGGATLTPAEGTNGGQGGTTDTATPTPAAGGAATPAEADGAATPTDSDEGGVSSDDDAGGLGWLGQWVTAFVVVVGVALVGAGEGKSRDWPMFRRLPVPAVTVVGLGQAASTASMSFLVRLSSTVPGLLAGLSTAAAATGSALSTALAGTGRGLGAAVVTVPRGIAHALAGVGTGLTGFLSTMTGTTTASGSGPGSFGGGRSSGSADSADGEDEDPDEPPATVEDAWVAMVERLPGGHRETKTPGELARLAVDQGFPVAPVETLTDAFRRVTYGGASPGDELTDEALAALTRIERGPEGEE